MAIPAALPERGAAWKWKRRSRLTSKSTQNKRNKFGEKRNGLAVGVCNGLAANLKLMRYRVVFAWPEGS